MSSNVAILNMGGTYANIYFTIIIGVLVFFSWLPNTDCVFNVSTTLGSPILSLSLFIDLVERIENIFINVYFPRKVEFCAYKSGK
jgi:hypothetical protein